MLWSGVLGGFAPGQPVDSPWYRVCVCESICIIIDPLTVEILHCFGLEDASRSMGWMGRLQAESGAFDGAGLVVP